MKFTIGGDMECDLEALIDTRLLIQANSGAGKSWCIRRILEQTHGQVQHLIIDPEGEFASLRERYDYVLAARHGGDTAADPRSAKLLAERLLELGVSAVLDIYELKAHERVRFVRLFIEALVDAPKKLWHPALVIVDEAHVYCPQKGDAESAGAIIDLATRGRKRGFCAVLATQRLSKLHKDAAAECNNKLIGRSSLDVDKKRAGEELGFSGREEEAQLRMLDPGEFFAFGPALARVVTPVKVGPVVTTHPKAGARLVAAPPPPTEQIQRLLPRLEDLPAEAEERQQTLDSLKRELTQARRDLTLARRQQAPPDEAVIERRVASAVAAERRDGENALRVTERNVASMEGAVRLAIKLAGQGVQQLEASLNGKERPSAPVRAAPPPVAHPVGRERPAMEPAVATQEGDINRPRQAILNALASLEGLGLTSIQKNMIGAFAGASPRSSAFTNNLGRLRSLGLIDYPQPGYAALTPEGRAASKDAQIITDVAALHEAWFDILPLPQGAIIRALIDLYPDDIDKTELASLVAASAISSAYTNNLGRLRTLKLIEYPGTGRARATDLLMRGGAAE